MTKPVLVWVSLLVGVGNGLVLTDGLSRLSSLRSPAGKLTYTVELDKYAAKNVMGGDNDYTEPWMTLSEVCRQKAKTACLVVQEPDTLAVVAKATLTLTQPMRIGTIARTAMTRPHLRALLTRTLRSKRRRWGISPGPARSSTRHGTAVLLAVGIKAGTGARGQLG